jgi:hypothetical protein
MVSWDCLTLVNKNRITRTYLFGAIFTILFFFQSHSSLTCLWWGCAYYYLFLCAFITFLFNYYYFLFRYVIMCIHFLQQRRPAILPCLQVCINLIQFQACQDARHLSSHIFLLTSFYCCALYVVKMYDNVLATTKITNINWCFADFFIIL